MKKPNTTTQQPFAMKITRWVGSPQSIIIHSIVFFLGFLTVLLNILPLDTLLLILNTIVSLEAIYLALFIQMTVNYTSKSLEGVEKDIDEIQGDIDEIQEDVDEIQGDIDEIQEDVDELSEDEKQERTKKKQRSKILQIEKIRGSLAKSLKDLNRIDKKRVSAADKESNIKPLV